MVPARQLIQYEDPKGVAYIQEVFIRRIMRHPDGIHVHILYQVYVQDAEVLVEGTSRRWPERVPAYSFELYPYSIDIDTIPFPQFHRAKAKTLFDAVKDIFTSGKAVYD